MGITKYFTEEELKESHREAVRRHRKKHPIRTRAHSLVQNYKKEDRKYNRGEGDLTAQWIMENIMFKPCAHCGKVGWDVIGCNRLDNSKPHTKDNVEPCCAECNHKLATEYQKILLGIPLDQIDKATGEVVHQWDSANQAAEELGFTSGRITDCCDGGYFDNRRNKWVNCNTYKGSIWKRHLICNT